MEEVMLTLEKCREIAAAAMSRMGPLSVYAADALFAAFEAERSTWIASIDVGDERSLFEERVHLASTSVTVASELPDEKVAAWAIARVRAVDAALAKERV